MIGHTPGPWEYQHRGDWYRITALGGRTWIADTIWNSQNTRHGAANARLLAAAPDLLAACQGLLPLLDDTETAQAYEPELKAMVEAISKAVGEERSNATDTAH